MEWLLLTRGVKGTLEWNKGQRHNFLKWLSVIGGPGTIERPARRKVRALWGRAVVETVLKSEGDDPVGHQTTRLVFTALTSLRAFRLPPTIDLGPIEEPGKVFDLPSLDLARKFWKALGFIPTGSRAPLAAKFEWPGFAFSKKAGPNGPALASALVDFSLLTDPLRKALSLLAGRTFESALRLLDGFQAAGNLPPMPEPRKRPWQGLRKLVGIPDAEGKTRVVAMLDAFSQSVLRAYHDFFMGILRKGIIPQDRTYSQGGIVDTVKG